MPQLILNIQNEKDTIFQSDKIACYIISSNLSAAKIKEIIATSKMVLVYGENSLDICKKYNLDGVYQTLDCSKPVKTQLKPMREALRHKTLGVAIPFRRHEAMLVGETEPDFIAFTPSSQMLEDILSWYNDLFLIPSAIDVDSSDVALKELKAEFLIIKSNNFKDFGC